MLLFAATDLSKPRTFLLGLIALFIVYFIYRFFAVQAARRKSERPPAAPAPGIAPIRGAKKGPVLLKLDSPTQGKSAAPGTELHSAPKAPTLAAKTPLSALERPPSPASDLFHAVLIVLAIVVAVGFLLVILPQAKFDDLAQSLQERRAGVQKEQFAFLYLGDEVQDKEFHIRGVVRNITEQQLEKIDAPVRLYAIDGRLLQTTVVRMDKESIAPDETSEFHMVYPNYDQNIGSYSVDFITRDGAIVNYKDMRAARARE
jgi:hypothetical protein